jgi:hypothetical protein
MVSKKPVSKNGSTNGSTNKKSEYFMNYIEKKLIDGKIIKFEKLIVESPSGLTMKFFQQSDKKTNKYIVKLEPGADKFILITKEGEDSKKDELSKNDLFKILASKEELTFMLVYIKNRIQKGGKKKMSKKKTQKSKKSKRSIKKKVNRISRNN